MFYDAAIDQQRKVKDGKGCMMDKHVSHNKEK